LHRNARYQTAEGPALDMGAFIVGLEAAAAMEVTVVGKPAPAFFSAALSDLGIGASDALMVGDDINSDVLGSQAVGMTGVLVRTGKFRPSDLDLDGTGPIMSSTTSVSFLNSYGSCRPVGVADCQCRLRSGPSPTPFPTFGEGSLGRRPMVRMATHNGARCQDHLDSRSPVMPILTHDHHRNTG